MQFGVKDNAFVLFQSTIHIGKFIYEFLQVILIGIYTNNF